MSNWTSNTIKANGIQLHYHRTGGDKPPLVLAHGITDTGLCWIRVAQVLQDDFDVIMVDARGHGHSDKPETGYSSADHAADLAGLIEALGLDKPALMGHSMGATSVATLASNYPELPGRIVLEDPPWRPATNETEQERRPGRDSWRQQIADYKSKSRQELVDFGKQRSPTWDDIEFGPWSEAKQLVSPNVVEFISHRRPWHDLVPNIICPTLLVTAGADLGAIVTSEVAQAIAQLNPNIRVAHIPGAGHNIRREQFAGFLEAVTAFLQDQ